MGRTRRVRLDNCNFYECTVQANLRAQAKKRVALWALHNK